MIKEYNLYAVLLFGVFGIILGIISGIPMGSYLFSSPWFAASFVMHYLEAMKNEKA